MTIGVEREMRTPETFAAAQLLVKDFDGTVAQTFEKSPNGIGVSETYVLAIESMFGVNAIDQYLEAGGLRNRAPIEVVQELAPDAKGDELNQLVDQFNGTKLGVLLEEIGSLFPDGTVWPRPTAGYLDLRERIEAARNAGLLIDDLVLSSGHESFMRKIYHVWDVGLPTYIIDEETARQQAGDLTVEQLVKPSPVLMDIAHNTWRKGYGLPEVSGHIPGERGRIIYIGDDPDKDGELAKSSGVDFVLLEADRSESAWRAVAKRLQIDSMAIMELINEPDQ